MQKEATSFGKQEEHLQQARKRTARSARLGAVALVAVLLFGGLAYLGCSGSTTIQTGASICQPCKTSRDCSPALQYTVSPSLSLTSLVPHEDAAETLSLQCENGFCATPSMVSIENSCAALLGLDRSRVDKPMAPSVSLVGRKLLTNGRAGSRKGQRSLQRLRNDKFTEYFHTRALSAGSTAGHGYLGVNYLHGREE